MRKPGRKRSSVVNGKISVTWLLRYYSLIFFCSVTSNSVVTCFQTCDGLMFVFLQNAKKRKRKMQEKDSKSKKKDFKF